MSKLKDRYDEIRRKMAESRAVPIPVLVVEDDDTRITKFERWLPPVFRLVHCRTGGAALGLLERSDTWDFPGVMLDFDLDKQSRTIPYVNGGQVLDLALSRLDHSTHILVHSTNDSAARRMMEDARRTNPTTRVDYIQMTRKLFRTWLDEVWWESVDRYNMFVEHDDAAKARQYACVIVTDWLNERDCPPTWSDTDEEVPEDETAVLAPGHRLDV